MGWNRNKGNWCIYERGQHTYKCNGCKNEGRAWSWKQCFSLVLALLVVPRSKLQVFKH